MESNYKSGEFGHYYRYETQIDDDRWLTLFPKSNRGLVVPTDGSVNIKASALAPFVTELIEMARVLGVTGGQDGR